jgi:hypothetical protein
VQVTLERRERRDDERLLERERDARDDEHSERDVVVLTDRVLGCAHPGTLAAGLQPYRERARKSRTTER